MDDNTIYTVPCSPPSRISLCSYVSVRRKDAFIIAHWSQHCLKWGEMANNQNSILKGLVTSSVAQRQWNTGHQWKKEQRSSLHIFYMKIALRLIGM